MYQTPLNKVKFRVNLPVKIQTNGGKIPNSGIVNNCG